MNNVHARCVHSKWKDDIIFDMRAFTFHRRCKPQILNGSYRFDGEVLMLKWSKFGPEYLKTKDSITFSSHNEDYKFDLSCNKALKVNIGKIIVHQVTNRIDNKVNTELMHPIVPLKYQEMSPRERQRLMKSNRQNVIPNIIHFVYGLKEQTEEFEFYKYVAIKSAHDVNKPEAIYFWYYYEPHGKYWDLIKDVVTLHKLSEIPQKIYDNQLCHYAHQSDVLRLQILQIYGGIYMDIDTICINSFKPLLTQNHKFIMDVRA